MIKDLEQFQKFTGWWLNHPSEKYARPIGEYRAYRGENKRYLEKPPANVQI